MINRRSFLKKSTALLTGAFMVRPLAQGGSIQLLKNKQFSEWTLINGLDLSINSPNSNYSQTDRVVTVTKNRGNWYEDVFMDNNWGASNLQSFKIELIAKCLTPGYGIGIGIKSVQHCEKPHWFGRMSENKLVISSTCWLDSNSSTVFSDRIVGDEDLLININDIVKYTFEIIENKIIYTVANQTTGNHKSISFTIDYSSKTGFVPPNIFKYCFLSCGGSFEVQSFIVITTNLKNPDLMFIGDSITQGLAQNADQSPDYNIYDSYPYLVNNILKRQINIHAAGGSVASDQLLTINEIIAINPRKCIVMLGANTPDRVGFANLVTQLNKAGIKVYPLTSPMVPADYNDWIKSTYANSIDAMVGYDKSSMEGFWYHPNQSGHALIARNILTHKI